MTVTPFALPARTLTSETSTPLSRRRPTQNLPRGSSPIDEVKPTRLPRRARLWAKIADELPRVIEKSAARCSRSGSRVWGRPYKIMSALSSPTTLTSKRFTLPSPGDAFHANALLKSRNVFSRNPGRQRCKTIGRAASNGERQAAFEGKAICRGERQSGKSRVAATNRRFGSHGRSPGMNRRFIVLPNSDWSTLTEADGCGFGATLKQLAGRLGGGYRILYHHPGNVLGFLAVDL